MRPFFGRSLLVLALVASLWSAVPASALETATFSNSKVTAAYSKIRAHVNGKIAAIPNLTAAERSRLAKAESDLVAAFRKFDRATASKSKAVKTAAAKDLSRAYSALSKLIASTVSSRVRTSVAAPVRQDSQSVAASPQATSAASSQPTVSGSRAGPGVDADVLYYADSFEGGGTAGGDRFTQSAYSAARCTVSLGRLLQISAEGKSVVVKANDRPNCAKHPDIADLTTTAFRALAPLSR